jgi:predicted RNase H-like HicB family nuclease
MMKAVRSKRGVMKRQTEIQALVHEEDGSFWAEVPSCPGLLASGETLDELAEALQEAWLLYHDVDPIKDADDQSRFGWVAETSSLTVQVPAFA